MSSFYNQPALPKELIEDSKTTREIFDLLNLLNHSYHALDIDELNDIRELKYALENVEHVKKKYLEKHSPADSESLGLASTFAYHEELETFERMVSFFHKKLPSVQFCWDMFSIRKGVLSLRNAQSEKQELQTRRREVLEKLVATMEEAEALGIQVFSGFESSLIVKKGKKYKIKKDAPHEPASGLP